ncbi:hypothetical protein EZS27_010092 [termite gut metagenome]|uniref:Uncharacterized protein n=1 Tax=termite gut metagenome TaxID=433724 RepID=A0A5J4S7S7_9ZZZZ
MNILSNYPDYIGTTLIPMIIAIFAIAFPLLLQTISKIDDKYSSTKLIKTFKGDPICKWYIRILIIAILVYFLWVLHLPRVIDCGYFNKLIDNSEYIFIGIGTLLLICMTFGIAYLIYVYCYPEKLLKRLIIKHNTTKSSKNKTLYFEAISQLLCYSIKKPDEEDLAKQSLEFYFEAFIKFRKGKEGVSIEYPKEYYNSILNANGLLCTGKKLPFSYFNGSTLISLLLDEYQHTIINVKTYRCIWQYLLQVLHYNREDFIFGYWKKAHQLFNFFLKPIDENYDDTFQIINQNEINQREQERSTFLEFHYALGGLLMSLEKYDLIKKITSWTNQQPPKYVLVPERMEEVIQRYMKVSTERKLYNPIYYEQKYPFPDVSGVSADGTIQIWIKRYLSILFLRQYTLHEYFITSAALSMPNPPSTLSEMKHWNDELESLDFFVNEYLANKEILDKVGLRELYENNWFENNKKEKPSILINKLKTQINESFEKTKQEQEIDSEKLEDFKRQTLKILTQMYENYQPLFNNGTIDTNYKSFFIDGHHLPMGKAGFAKDQEISYVNCDSIVAEAVSMEFNQLALNVFVLMQHEKYQLKEEDLFLAIDELNIDLTKFVVVAVGINMYYYSTLKNKELQQKNGVWYYNQIRIIEINNYMNELTSQSLFVIHKEDLPSIVYNEVPESDREKFKLEKIDEQKNIYVSVLDLHKEEYSIIKNEIKSTGQEDLSKSVLVCVDINTEIRYKSSAKCIQLKTFSSFNDRGTMDSLSAVKSIWSE